MRRDGGAEPYWSRPESRVWTAMLLLGTCLLYCARVTVPICAVALSSYFDWDKKQFGVVLSSFFWGYCLTQIVGGHVSDQIGGEKVLLLSASAWGFLTVLTPLLTHITSAHLVFMTSSRFLMGLLQGVYFPSLASLLSQRVRESERAFTYSTVGTGSQFGAVIIAQLSTASTFFTLLSWLPTFFKETFPESKVPQTVKTFANKLSSDNKSLLVFTSFQGWVFNVVPWLVAIPTSLFSGFLSDHLISQGYRTITIRKFMQVIGSGLSSIFALCLGQTSSFCKAIVFASASVGLQTFNHSGISVNVQDLAPSCAGLLFGVVCVYLAGYLIETTGSWISVFNLVAAVNSIGLCTFLLFGEAQRVDTDSVYVDL
ncbi:hypothetical protein DUI87_27925 [Hirundo rustica rustica]|uniref:Major facilitator superfamily (MFS) profile domain-containing protein n=1 Tax=Hirundo rustica rustica TaxID=333673 RepID=A0A3M0J310_HIRRU|nr:hypothetical protein DUI87_27925 [Hirundo rustica rustica]